MKTKLIQQSKAINGSLYSWKEEVVIPSTMQEIEQKLSDLREQWKQALPKERKQLEIRGKLYQIQLQKMKPILIT